MASAVEQLASLMQGWLSGGPKPETRLWWTLSAHHLCAAVSPLRQPVLSIAVSSIQRVDLLTNTLPGNSPAEKTAGKSGFSITTNRDERLELFAASASLRTAWVVALRATSSLPPHSPAERSIKPLYQGFLYRFFARQSEVGSWEKCWCTLLESELLSSRGDSGEARRAKIDERLSLNNIDSLAVEEYPAMGPFRNFGFALTLSKGGRISLCAEGMSLQMEWISHLTERLQQLNTSPLLRSPVPNAPCSGWLYRCGGVHVKWQRRWATLEETVVGFHVDKTLKGRSCMPLAAIRKVDTDLHLGTTLGLPPGLRQGCEFYILTMDRKRTFFYAEGTRQAVTWVGALREAMPRRVGNDPELSLSSSTPHTPPRATGNSERFITQDPLAFRSPPHISSGPSSSIIASGPSREDDVGQLYSDEEDEEREEEDQLNSVDQGVSGFDGDLEESPQSNGGSSSTYEPPQDCAAVYVDPGEFTRTQSPVRAFTEIDTGDDVASKLDSARSIPCSVYPAAREPLHGSRAYETDSLGIVPRYLCVDSTRDAHTLTEKPGLVHQANQAQFQEQLAFHSAPTVTTATQTAGDQLHGATKQPVQPNTKVDRCTLTATDMGEPVEQVRVVPSTNQGVSSQPWEAAPEAYQSYQKIPQPPIASPVLVPKDQCIFSQAPGPIFEAPVLAPVAAPDICQVQESAGLVKQSGNPVVVAFTEKEIDSEFCVQDLTAPIIQPFPGPSVDCEPTAEKRPDEDGASTNQLSASIVPVAEEDEGNEILLAAAANGRTTSSSTSSPPPISQTDFPHESHTRVCDVDASTEEVVSTLDEVGAPGLEESPHADRAVHAQPYLPQALLFGNDPQELSGPLGSSVVTQLTEPRRTRSFDTNDSAQSGFSGDSLQHKKSSVVLGATIGNEFLPENDDLISGEEPASRIEFLAGATTARHTPDGSLPSSQPSTPVNIGNYDPWYTLSFAEPTGHSPQALLPSIPSLPASLDETEYISSNEANPEPVQRAVALSSTPLPESAASVQSDRASQRLPSSLEYSASVLEHEEQEPPAGNCNYSPVLVPALPLNEQLGQPPSASASVRRTTAPSTSPEKSPDLPSAVRPSSFTLGWVALHGGAPSLGNVSLQSQSDTDETSSVDYNAALHHFAETARHYSPEEVFRVCPENSPEAAASPSHPTHSIITTSSADPGNSVRFVTDLPVNRSPPGASELPNCKERASLSEEALGTQTDEFQDENSNLELASKTTCEAATDAREGQLLHRAQTFAAVSQSDVSHFLANRNSSPSTPVLLSRATSWRPLRPGPSYSFVAERFEPGCLVSKAQSLRKRIAERAHPLHVIPPSFVAPSLVPEEAAVLFSSDSATDDDFM